MTAGWLLRVAAVTLVYVAAGKVGLSLAFVNASASAVWAPSGIAVAAFLVLGRSAAVGVLIAAFIVNVTTAGGPVASLAIAAGNTLEGYVGAWLIARYCGGLHVFERVGWVFRFAAVAIVAPIVSATTGVTTLAASGGVDASSYGLVWTTWWLGDVSGILIVTPLILTWRNGGTADARRPSRVDLVVLIAIALVVGAVVFAGVGPLSVTRAPIAFATFPPLAYAAYRYGPRGASLAVAGVAAVAAWGTLRGFGPFARDDPNDSLLFLQAFMAVVSLTGLTLAAADVERRRSAEALRAGEERLRRVEVEQRDEFLSIAAHELRTPTTSLQLAAQLAVRRLERARGADSSELVRALETVAAQSAKLSRLVSQLFDNVRIDAGRLRISPERADLGALVATIADEARAVSGGRDITVTAPAVDAFVDPLRIEQVVRNLIDNAVKYSPRGGTIEVDVAPVAGAVRIAVRDHGEGVPPERREGLFDRYQQAHDRHEPGGLGLGLYVSRQIVEQHGGTIVAQFPDDGGMRVVVTLPGREEGQASSM